MMSALARFFGRLFGRVLRVEDVPPARLASAGSGSDRETFAIGYQIVEFEARRDRDGDVIAYQLPSNDGGGRYEFAGINERYHPDAVRELVAMHKSRRESYCARYIENYVRSQTGLSGNAAVGIRTGTLFFVLDTTFNRGGGGSAWVVQKTARALGIVIAVDGAWGPVTRAALREMDRDFSGHVVPILRKMREQYERQKVGYRENFWRGLVNRWNKAETVAENWNARLA